jgi:hypothetical protein
MPSLHPLNGQRLAYWLAGLVLLLLFSSCTPSYSGSGTTSGYTPGIRPFIDTWNNIHLFQSFDYKISDPAAVANHYDFVWGAELDHVAAIRAGNPNIFISYYITYNRDNGTFSNFRAYHDLAYWKAVHPDWVLYKCDRVTPAYEFGDPNVPLDFANPDLLSWQIQTYAQPASESGYDGIAADNLDLQNQFGVCGVYINGQWVQRYTGQLDDPRWRTDVINWLTRMQQALHHLRHPLALIPNLALDGLSPNDPQVQQIVNSVDGMLDEEGFTHCGQGYLTGSDWMQRIHFMENMQKQQKPYYVVNQFDGSAPINSEEIQWALASYLMGKEHLAALFISTYQGYGDDTRYSAYGAQIGRPIDAMYQSQNIYWRDYSNGLSIVNPNATDTVTIRLRTLYVDLHGKPVSQVITMPPHSGLVLLSKF